jgi:hypothetical protein
MEGNAPNPARRSEPISSSPNIFAARYQSFSFPKVNQQLARIVHRVKLYPLLPRPAFAQNGLRSFSEHPDKATRSSCKQAMTKPAALDTVNRLLREHWSG